MIRNRKAEEEFVRQYRSLIFAIATKAGLSREDQEDVLTRVFVRLWDNDCHGLRQWSGTGSLSSFIATVVRHLIHDAQSAQQPLAVFREDFGLPMTTSESCLQRKEIENTVILRDQFAALITEISHLRPRDADLITRRHLDDQSYREMADDMQLTVNHIGVALARAEARLKERALFHHRHLFEHEDQFFEHEGQLSDMS